MDFPKVGVGVFVLNDGKFLLGKRKGAHGEGSWSLPGGHLEFNEEVEECAKREVFEEVGIKIKNIRKGPFTNDIFKVENKHYITCFVFGEYDSGDVRVMEPDRCEEWRWFSWEELPKDLFLPIRNLMDSGFSFSESYK